MVTQRIANPFIPVRFWAWPPYVFVNKKNHSIIPLSNILLEISLEASADK